MALGRARRITGHVLPELQPIVDQANRAITELDRRKPVSEPSVFSDNSSRPAAEKYAGRVIYVGGTVNELQYSDGTNWRSILAGSVSFAVPVNTYASTEVEGSASTVMRSDATFQFPQALMAASGGTDTLTLTQAGTDLTLTPSNSGVMKLATTGTGWSITDGSGITSALLSLVGDFDNPTSTLIAPSWSGGAISTVRTLACWDAAFSAVNGAWTGTPTFYGYRMSAFSLTPTSGGGTVNAYGANFKGPTLNNNNAVWSAGNPGIGTLYLENAGRGFTAPTLATAYNTRMEMPTIGSTNQYGLYIENVTESFNTTPTTRTGLYIGDMVRGTTRYAIQATVDPSYLASILQDDSVKLKQGTGRDAETYYDGTNFILDPDAVGTGRVLIGATGDDDMLLNAIEIDGDLNHDGTNVGFYGVAPTARSAAYTPTNVTTDRSYDANATTLDEIADVLGTLIADLQLTGIIA